ncbi:MAG TPA: hypothetical protein PLP83_08315 [Candidatus Aminicenantes bacterium]|nr:hypothetical protein [Candidatus Aminicenantes bacterium]
MFSVKGFAAGLNAILLFVSAAAATVDSNIAATDVVPKPAGSSGAPPTSVTVKPMKGKWTNVTGNALIAGAGRHFPLWIKVPQSL